MDTCFICLSNHPPEPQRTCDRGACHNLKAHPLCFLELVHGGTTHCSICGQCYHDPPESPQSYQSTAQNSDEIRLHVRRRPRPPPRPPGRPPPPRPPGRPPPPRGRRGRRGPPRHPPLRYFVGPPPGRRNPVVDVEGGAVPPPEGEVVPPEGEVVPPDGEVVPPEGPREGEVVSPECHRTVLGFIGVAMMWACVWLFGSVSLTLIAVYSDQLTSTFIVVACAGIFLVMLATYIHIFISVFSGVVCHVCARNS